MRDTDMVVVIGSGTKFHASYQTELLRERGIWRTVCGTGFGKETPMLAIDAWRAGWRPCVRCFGEEDIP